MIPPAVDERDEPYSVKGVVQLDDGREPSNVGITVGYPPSPPEDQYGNFHLSIWKTGRRDLPALTVNCPGYRIRGVNLSDPKLATITDRRIEISKIVLARIPKMSERCEATSL
jgi:hypothetical protein